MIPAANRYTVVLDASVLFQNMKRDILLRFFEADLYRARWSEMVQQEWLTRAKQKFPDKAAAFDRIDALMRQHFEDAWVEHVERYIDLIELPDPDDRHVVAAAIACKAHYIVTDNVRDFPAETLADLILKLGARTPS